MNLSRCKKAAPPARYFPLVNRGQRFSEILPRFTEANVIKELSSAAMRTAERKKNSTAEDPLWTNRDREFYFLSAAETGTSREKWIREGEGGETLSRRGRGRWFVSRCNFKLADWPRVWMDPEEGDRASGGVRERERESRETPILSGWCTSFQSPGAD